MRSTDLFRFATKALTERKLKAVLVIIGIAIGPATIVALVGATQGYTNAATDRFSSLGATTILVSSVGRGTTLTSADVSIIEALGGVSYVLPYDEISGQITQGGQTVGVTVIATDLSELHKVLPSLSLAQGTAPATSDQVGADIGYSIAFPGISGATNATVGEVLTLSNVGRSSFSFAGAGVEFQFSSSNAGSAGTTQRSFIVDGIYSKYGQGFGINPDSSVFVPLSTGQLILHSEDYSGLLVVASSVSAVNAVESEITNVYGQNVRTTSVSFLLSSIESVTSGTTTLLEAVAGTSVLVAFIGIMTTMLTSVIERTKEIGILKALGTSSRGIMSTFLAEALVTGLVGGMAGAVAGYGLSYAIISVLSGSSLALGAGGGVRFGPPSSTSTTSTLAITPAISPELIALAVLLAVAVGTLGGLLPAWRASRMNPVEALKRS